MAHSYSHLFKLPTTGLRFFTVYGPWGRPDMALFKFTKNILEGKKIQVYNYGKHSRDFTYIDDIVNSIYLLTKSKIKNKKSIFKIINIGKGKSDKLTDYISRIEIILNKKAKKNYVSLQKGDIIKTHSSIEKLKKYSGYSPKIFINNGVEEFIKWYKKFT